MEIHFSKANAFYGNRVRPLKSLVIKAILNFNCHCWLSTSFSYSIFAISDTADIFQNRYDTLNFVMLNLSWLPRCHQVDCFHSKVKTLRKLLPHIAWFEVNQEIRIIVNVRIMVSCITYFHPFITPASVTNWYFSEVINSLGV